MGCIFVLIVSKRVKTCQSLYYCLTEQLFDIKYLLILSRSAAMRRQCSIECSGGKPPLDGTEVCSNFTSLPSPGQES